MDGRTWLRIIPRPQGGESQEDRNTSLMSPDWLLGDEISSVVEGKVDSPQTRPLC